MRRSIFTVFVVGANLVVGAMMLAANAALAQQSPSAGEGQDRAVSGCVDAPAVALSASNVHGGGGLCIDDLAVHPTLRVGGLTSGDVYTAWLGYFDRPSTCVQAPCGIVDLHGDDPPGVLVRIGGGVSRSDGELELRTDLPDLRLAAGAQVTLLLLHHGPVIEGDTRRRARQLLTPQTPNLGSPMAGATADGAKAWPHAQVVLTLR
jgi:hypothetical protein